MDGTQKKMTGFYNVLRVFWAESYMQNRLVCKVKTSKTTMSLLSVFHAVVIVSKVQYAPYFYYL